MLATVDPPLAAVAEQPPSTTLHPVLVAEDDPLYRRVLQHLLSAKGYEVEVVTDGETALQKAAGGGSSRLLILDWVMPRLLGPEVCHNIRAGASEHYQYILLLTARNTTEDIVAGLEAGADDYLVKPFNAHELLARVRVGERMLRLHDHLLAIKESLRFQATHDPLTGIWNRGALFELLNAEVERAARKRSWLSLFLVDIDHFKRVNDEHGHQVGDAVLQEVASRLSAVVRPYDVIGRYGGEEFIIAAAEFDLQAACGFAERLRAAISSLPVRNTDAVVDVTVSIGVATGHASPIWSLHQLIRSADAALYRAKTNGRNRVEAVEQSAE
jgi:two-component system, cell cycle response regulator